MKSRLAAYWGAQGAISQHLHAFALGALPVLLIPMFQGQLPSQQELIIGVASGLAAVMGLRLDAKSSEGDDSKNV